MPGTIRARDSLIFHRGSLAPDEVVEIAGIPVTTVARTLFDLAAVLPRFRLESAMREAEYRRLADVVSLPDLICRYPGQRGVVKLRSLLARDDLGESRTHSELEDRFRAFLLARGFALGAFNVPMQVGSLRIIADCVWRDQRVIVELDGRAAHERAATFEGDRRRDRKLLAADSKPARLTWHQLELDSDELESDLRELLAGRPPIP